MVGRFVFLIFHCVIGRISASIRLSVHSSVHPPFHPSTRLSRALEWPAKGGADECTGGCTDSLYILQGIAPFDSAAQKSAANMESLITYHAHSMK